MCGWSPQPPYYENPVYYESIGAENVGIAEVGALLVEMLSGIGLATSLVQ